MPDTPPSKCLLIFASPRSGSTYISNSLANTGLIANPNEWLHEEILLEREKVYSYKFGPSPSYPSLIKDIVSSETGSNGVFSAKIMWPQFVEFLKNLEPSRPLNIDLQCHLLHRFFPNPKILFIVRRDELRQAISWTRATKTRIWHRIKGLTTPGAAMFDFPTIEYHINEIRKHNNNWRKLLQKTTLPSHSIVYEDFIKDPKFHLEEILEFLGLEVQEPVIAEYRPSTLASDQLNKDWEFYYRETLNKMNERKNGKPAKGYPSNLNFTITRIEGPKEIASAKQEWISVEVRNKGPRTWPALGMRDGKNWIALVGRWFDREQNRGMNNVDRAFLPADIPAGQSTTLKLLMTAPERPGDYTLFLRMAYTSEKKPFYLCDDSNFMLPIHVSGDQSTEKARHFFGDAPVVGMVWTLNPWFGSYLANKFPWIYHKEHGWLFCNANGAGQKMFWCSEIGWFFTTPDDYPKIYVDKYSQWLLYHKGTSKPRVFENLTTGELLELGESNLEIFESPG